MFLQSQDLSLHHKGAAPIHFPDLSLKNADQALLLGPSGSGKTTLLSGLAGLLKPSTGTILIEGQDLYALPSAKRDHLRGQNFGFVFQNLHLLPSLTLAQNIMLAADMAKTKPDQGRLPQLLETLGLQDKAGRKPSALSQGEQQRAAIARAILLKPKIIIADEPTSALDDDNAKAVITLLTTQAKETGAALLIATHDHRIKNHFTHIITLHNQKEKAA